LRIFLGECNYILFIKILVFFLLEISLSIKHGDGVMRSSIGMKMIFCSACGKQMHETAAACPLAVRQTLRALQDKIKEPWLSFVSFWGFWVFIVLWLEKLAPEFCNY